ncbi:hypothetical protein [Methylobacterium oxalidis]|uniref:hypothetical protein n=1 Tax=Methylobacterium oxalidis TaxID=944322 RepID=UPI003315B8C1
MPKGLDRTFLDDADQDVREAEQRRKEQASLVAKLAGHGVDEPGLDAAKRLLLEIERTLAVVRAHRSLLQSLVGGE